MSSLFGSHTRRALSTEAKVVYSHGQKSVSAQVVIDTVVKTEGGKSTPFPNILLLSDAPPCKGYPGTLNLLQMCNQLPHDRLRGFFVVNPEIGVTIDEHYRDIPQMLIKKPQERLRSLPGKLGTLQCFLKERYTEAVTIPPITRSIEEFIRTHNCELIWCVIQGQTIIRIARELQLHTNIKMVTQVWDPPEWWLRSNLVDSRSQRRILALFDEVIENSNACAAAGWAMAEDYAKRYGVAALPVIAGLAANLAKAPKTKLNDSDTFVIGYAGQIYAWEEWNCLMATLDAVNWRIDNRRVIVRLMGQGHPFWSMTPKHIEYLGMREQAEVLEILSTCDILYCPYWLTPMFEKEARHSFPSKLTTYLATGRPVLFHGPGYASPARFLKEQNAGLLCTSLYKSELLNTLQRFVFDEELYASLATNGNKAFHSYLTADCMQEQFAKCLEIATNKRTR